MIKNIIKVANSLDQRGLTKEADILDQLLVKMAQMAEEESEDSSESDEIISATTTLIDRLSQEAPSEERDKRLEILNSLLEDSLNSLGQLNYWV